MKETSRCSQVPAREMAMDYKRRGFTGMVITDHFVNGHSYADEPDTWEEKMEVFSRGYRAAKAAGDEIGLKVYYGLEYTYRRSTGEDYLALGLTEEQVLRDLKDCDQWQLEDFIDKVHALGGIIIRAHPFRQAEYIKTPAPDRSGLNVDAIEVFNGGNAKELYNYQAMEWALKEKKPMVAGSDTHTIPSNATNYIGFEQDPADYKALCQAIREGKAFIIHKPKE